MIRRMRLWLGLLLAGVIAIAAAPAQACGCGMALEATVTRERALVVDTPGKEQIVLSLDLRSDGAGRSAIVLPVPADPQVTAIGQGDPLQYLDVATAPKAAAGGGDEGVAGAAPGRGVDVIGRDQIGGYDVSRLRADDAGALDDWLDENGYTLPDGAEPILDDYVDEGWRYVAVQLAANSSGTLKPLAVSFDTDDPVYPMRLTQLATDPVDITLYTLASGRRSVDGLDEAYAGPVAELDPAPPPELTSLFAEGTYVTKLTAFGTSPDRFTSDFEIRGGSGTAASGGGSPGWGAPIAVLAALLGFGLLAFSRR
ncbi:MAG: hypothetical protein QOI80_2017 [Solirubrobacteraceae bacterium]|jgi:hypothetical protein|nr:hypothetical protein [Solirubrobacteraceae bacterium]